MFPVTPAPAEPNPPAALDTGHPPAALDTGHPSLREPAPAELARAATVAAGAALHGFAPAGLAQIVPAPASVRPEPGTEFTLTADTAIRVTAQPAAVAVATYLAELLRPATGHPFPVTEAEVPDPVGAIALALGDPGTGDEGYRLDITTEGVTITAPAPAGLFHAVQTLRQLLPAAIEGTIVTPGPWVLPGARIVDTPRFPYRGAMLDVCRHFFPVADVLRFIDHLARYKLNHLHLHLTDDQGWRIAIDSWPRLGPVGGATQVGGGPGGYYTRADYQRIVAYAAARFVTVVPEIDLPGHTNAALTAYGELAPDGVAPPAYTGTEVGFSALDTASERTYAFVADVVREVAELTPGPYLHIGGDEAFTVQAADYAAFVDRVQPIVAATGKTVLGWHQIAPSAHVTGRVLQYWGTTGTDDVVRDAVGRGARLILSPGNRTYLDMKYAPDTPIGHDWAGLIDVRQAYDWDPGAYLAGVTADAVLGVEAPLWTETVATLAEIEYLTFPRLPAVAELGWSPATARDWADFRQRLATQGARWTAAGIAFHRSVEVPWPAVGVPAQRTAEATGADHAGTGSDRTGTDPAPMA